MVGRALSVVAFAALVLGGSALAASGCGSSDPKTASGGGGSGGGATTSSTGGAPPECSKPSDCPAPHSVCSEAACVAGQCSTAPIAAGTPLGDDKTGDCQQLVCDGEGSSKSVADDKDAPASTDCVANACVAGAVKSDVAAAGSPCDTGVCDPKGNCVGCNTVADCDQPNNECITISCDAGTCVAHNKGMGTLVSTQTTGDCKSRVCNGNGGQTDVPDTADVNDDGNECTADSCGSDGSVKHDPVTGPCGVGGVLMCQDGKCGGCTDASQCPQGDFCKAPVCNGAGICDFSFTPAGTKATTGQTANDCSGLGCDGDGTPHPVAGPTDLPTSDGNDCTVETCTGTMGSRPPASIGTSCHLATGGTGVCDANGACHECNGANDCTPSGTICVTTACTNNKCVTSDNDGATCGAADCMGGVATAASKCAGGSCVPGATQTCSPYICGADACTSTCADNPGCASGDVCDTGIKRCVANGAPTCTAYCAEMATNCTASHAMYFSNDACLATCAALPLGSVADMGSQDTLGCRLYHGGAPSQTAPDIHCPHAGPAGEGLCGGECESFCTLAAGLCTGANAQWASMDACMADCATFPTTPPYNATIASGNSYACRLYHLTAASVDPNGHCGHIQKNSITCQ